MKKLVLILSLIFFNACNNNVPKPDDLIGKNKMSDILVDIYIYKQGSYTQQTPAKKVDYKTTNKIILEQHKVNQQQFEDSYAYYVAKPDLYNAILDETKEKLNEKLPESEREKEKPNEENKEKSEGKNKKSIR